MADLTPQQFATEVLRGLNIKPTAGAVQALVGWARAEGGHWHNSAKYNPLNTTQPEPGAGNTGTQGNIKVYRDWRQGVQATVKTLRNGRYGGIIAGLKSGNPGAVAAAIGKSPWGTGGSLVAQTIGSTPRPTTVPQASLGPSKPSTPAAAAAVPGAAGVLDRQGVLQQYLAQRGRPGSLLGLAQGLGDAQAAERATKSAAATAAPVAPSTASFTTPPMQSGAAVFEGKQVAAWIKPALEFGRQHGWKGTVTSGLRSFADQTRIYNSGVRPAAKPGTSNHESTQFPRGAVDVSDPQGLARALAKSPYAQRLQWAGAKDPVHFSHPHNGSY